MDKTLKDQMDNQFSRRRVGDIKHLNIISIQHFMLYRINIVLDCVIKFHHLLVLVNQKLVHFGFSKFLELNGNISNKLVVVVIFLIDRHQTLLRLGVTNPGQESPVDVDLTEQLQQILWEWCQFSSFHRISLQSIMTKFHSLHKLHLYKPQ